MNPAVNSIRPHDSFRGRGLAAAGAGEEVQRSKVERIQRGNDGDAVHPVAEATDEEPKDEEKIEALAEEEEGHVVPTLPTPYQPSRSEYLDHCVTNYPYRSWCSHCVEGRGREFGHLCKPCEPSRCPAVSFDDCFIGNDGDVSNEEEFEAAGGGAAKVLVVRDSKSKAVFAHVVPTKGLERRVCWSTHWCRT